MEATNAQQIENVIQSNISVLLGEYGWMFLAALAVLFFKTTIESTIAGLIIFIGNDYNNDDMTDIAVASNAKNTIEIYLQRKVFR